MPKPDRGGRVLAWMCVLIAVNQLGFGSVVPALALYARTFGVSQSAIGLAIAVYGLARFVLALPVGKLADLLGRRSALALGGLVTATGNLLCAYARNYPAFIAARFVAGAGAALVLTAGLIVIADITEPTRRGRTMAIYQGVFLFAVGIGPLPGGLLAEHYGLAAPFLAYAIAGSVVSALAWLSVPETRALYAHDHTIADALAPLPSFASQVRALIGRAGFVLVSVIGFTNAVARTGGLFNVIPVLGADRLGLTADRIGLALAAASSVGLLVTYPAGALVDRFGRKPVIVPSTIAAGVALGVFVFAPSYGWFLTACLVWSVASGVSGAAPAAYAADIAPPGTNAAAMSTYRMLSDLGYVVGPIALGVVTDLVGANIALGATAVILVAVAVAFARFAPETFRAGVLSTR
jgi:MFS family permease